MVWFSSLIFLEFSLIFSVLYINKLFGCILSHAFIWFKFKFLGFNKGSELAVIWEASNFGYDKYVEHQVVCC